MFWFKKKTPDLLGTLAHTLNQGAQPVKGSVTFSFGTDAHGSTTPSATAESSAGIGGTTPPADPPKTGTGPSKREPDRPQKSFMFSLGFWLLILALLLVLDLFVWYLSPSAEKSPIGVNYGLVVAILVIGYFALSMRQVDSEETGGLFFFGRPIADVDSGPVFVPLGLCTLEKLPQTWDEMELPAEPELVYDPPKSADGKILNNNIPIEERREGARPPIRVTFAGKAGGSENPLELQLTSPVTPVATVRIISVTRFVRTFGTIPELRKQIEDICVTFFNETLSQVTLQDALSKMAEYSAQLTTRVKERVAGSGVEVKSVAIKQISLFHDINHAIAQPAIRTAEAQAGLITAEAGKKIRKLEGEGEGAKRKAILDGETAGLKNRAEELKIDPLQTLAAQTAVDATSSGKVVIVGAGGVSELMGLASATKAALRDQAKK